MLSPTMVRNPHVQMRGESERISLMLDTHDVARSLTDAEFTPAQADAITNAVRLAAEHGNHVTSDEFKVGLAACGKSR